MARVQHPVMLLTGYNEPSPLSESTPGPSLTPSCSTSQTARRLLPARSILPFFHHPSTSLLPHPHLPWDVVSLIVTQLSDHAPTLLALTHTSKDLAVEAEKVLYKHVALSKPSALAAFCDALAANPCRTEYVHSLVYPPIPNSPLSDKRALRDLVLSLPNLKHFAPGCMTVPIYSLRSKLVLRAFWAQRFPFTRLQSLKLPFHELDPLIPFLRSQSHIQSLEVHSAVQKISDRTRLAAAQRTLSGGMQLLPRLSKLAGSLEFVSCFVPGRAVKNLEIYVATAPHDPDLSEDMPSPVTRLLETARPPLETLHYGSFEPAVLSSQENRRALATQWREACPTLDIVIFRLLDHDEEWQCSSPSHPIHDNESRPIVRLGAIRPVLQG